MAEGITDPVAGWDGRAPNGKEANVGIYYYVIYIGDKVYKGDITLLR